MSLSWRRLFSLLVLRIHAAGHFCGLCGIRRRRRLADAVITNRAVCCSYLEEHGSAVLHQQRKARCPPI